MSTGEMVVLVSVAAFVVGFLLGLIGLLIWSCYRGKPFDI